MPDDGAAGVGAVGVGGAAEAGPATTVVAATTARAVTMRRRGSLDNRVSRGRGHERGRAGDGRGGCHQCPGRRPARWGFYRDDPVPPRRSISRIASYGA